MEGDDVSVVASMIPCFSVSAEQVCSAEDVKLNKNS